MNADFHFYGTGTAAMAAGLNAEGAKIIANAAEFVDYFIGDYYWSYWRIVPDYSWWPVYLYTIDYPQLSSQNIGAALDYYHDYWLAFHFPPGNFQPVRKQYSGEMAKLQDRYLQKFLPRNVNPNVKNGTQLCRPYSQFIIDMISDTIDTCQAIKAAPGESWKDYIRDKISPHQRYLCDSISRDQLALIFLGIRMHILADTWAHQDFTGFDDTSINYCNGDVFADIHQTGKIEKAIYEFRVHDTDCNFVPLSGKGHGNMGHYPDYGWLNIYYPASWRTDANPVHRDNPIQFKEAWKELAAVITMALFPGKSSDIAMPADVERDITQLFELHTEDIFAPFQCENFWANDAGRDIYIPKHWRDLYDSPEIGVTHGLAKTRWGSVWIKDGSILHMYELAALMHFSWCERWTRENPVYGWVPIHLQMFMQSHSTDRLIGTNNEFLETGMQLISSQNKYKLIYQEDGNLVIYRIYDGKALWASNTNGKPAWRTCMQPDGNFVIYEAFNKPVWASDTQSVTSAIIMQDDGNLVIYGEDMQVLWASGTN